MQRRTLLALPLAAWAAEPKQLAADPLRPQCHFLPPTGWMNDPNGPIHHNGTYHLFFQYNPQEAQWGDIIWGHATSKDLVHWRHEPVALRPTPNGADKDGVWSGCAVVHNGTPTLMYTGVRPEVQMVATSKDWLTWEKIEQPVIAAPPPGLTVTGFRDPQLWQEGQDWLCAIGSGVKGEGGKVLLYQSRDLRTFHYQHVLFEGPYDKTVQSNSTVATGEMWECPDFFRLGDRWVLLISTQGKVRWYTGDYKNRRFTAGKEGIMDYGEYYAPKSFLGPGNRRLIWGWVRERRSKEDQLKAGWSGVMSYPRELTVTKDGTLVQRPPKELLALRTGKPIAGKMAGISLTGTNGSYELEIRDPGHLTATGPVPFSLHGNELRVGDRRAPLPAQPKVLRLYVDGSTAEFNIDDQVWLTERIYDPAALSAPLYQFRGAIPASVQAWALQPISPNRLTA